MQIQQQHNFSGLLSKEMVVYIMALNPLNILLSEAAPLIYDNHKTTDYYWTNFSDIKKKPSGIFLSNLSACNKRFGGFVPEDKQIKLPRAHLANTTAAY